MARRRQEEPEEHVADSSSQNDELELESDDESAGQYGDAQLDDKDSDEEELERLVLGDTGTFRERLFTDDFGIDASDLHARRPATSGDDDSDLEDVDDNALFFLDTATSGGDKQLTVQPQKNPASDSLARVEDVPAWEDSDDERLTISLATATRLRKLRMAEAEDEVTGTEYTRRLRQQFLRLNPLPAWAKEAEGPPAKRRRRSSAAASDESSETSSDQGSDEEDIATSALPLDKFLRDANALRGDSTSRVRKLRPEVLDIQRSRDIPDVHKEGVTSLSFHPEYPVLLSASTASILYLHHIAPTAYPTPNPVLTSAQVKALPVRRAEFLYPQGDKIFFAGRRRFIHSWDLPSGSIQKTSKMIGHRLEQKTWERFRTSPCGRYIGLIASTRKGGGIVNIVNVNSMQWVAAARLDSRGGIIDFQWWRNGNGMTILGKGGQIGEFSLATKTFVGIWIDEGSVGATAIALGGRGGLKELGEDQWVAIGSNTGVMNIYERSDLIKPSTDEKAVVIKSRPTPKQAFMQLTTPVTVLTFSPDGQLLGFGSIHKKDAFRLVHVPTCTVYRNWPTEQTPLGRITTVAFGRQNDVLAVANDAGKIRLWEIRA